MRAEVRAHRLWFSTRWLVAAFLSISFLALPAASALDLGVPGGTRLTVYQDDQVPVLIRNATANASLVSQFTFYPPEYPEAGRPVFIGGPVLQADANGSATLFFRASDELGMPGLWELTVKEVNGTAREDLWYVVRPDPGKIDRDIRDALAEMRAIAAGVHAAVLLGVSALIGIVLLVEVRAYWREKRPAHVRLWARRLWRGARRLFSWEIVSLLNAIVRKPGNRGAWHHNRFKMFVRTADRKQAAIEEHVALASTLATERDELLARAEAHREEGLKLVPDDPHYKDWSAVDRTYTRDELAALGVKPKPPARPAKRPKPEVVAGSTGGPDG